MGLSPFVKAGAAALPGAGRLPFLPGGGGEIPSLERSSEPAVADTERLAAYSRVCGFTLRETLPATWPHIPAFGLHMALITDGGFPLAPMGLVHISNEITQLRPIGTGEELTVTARTTPLEPHPKGRAFSLLTEARVGEERVWTERSTMLRRGGGTGEKTGEGASDSGGSGRQPEPPAVASWWKLPGDLGARYAAVSGDSNPIHMHSLTAKPFGFPRAIAHGMWTKARCLAALESKLPDAYTVEVRFGKPILLPSKVGFGSRGRSDGIDFVVVGRKPGSPHLEGTIR